MGSGYDISIALVFTTAFIKQHKKLDIFHFTDDNNKMRKSIIIFLFVLFLFALIACSTGRKYNIYRLEGGEEMGNYGEVKNATTTSLYGIFYNLRSDGDYYWGRLNIDGGQGKKEFDFVLRTTIVDRGKTLFELEKGFYTEPYNLSIGFDTGYGAERVIINKMLFRSKNQVIDLRKKVTVGGNVDTKKLSDFENSGVIYPRYVNNDVIKLYYKNVDVIFKKNSDFTIECDITIEYEDDRIDNYAFTAKFKRFKFTERICLPTYGCTYLIYGLFIFMGR